MVMGRMGALDCLHNFTAYVFRSLLCACRALCVSFMIYKINIHMHKYTYTYIFKYDVLIWQISALDWFIVNSRMHNSFSKLMKMQVEFHCTGLLTLSISLRIASGK